MAFVRQRQNPQIVGAQGLSFVWDVDSLDWKDLSAVEITERVTGKVQSESIVLLYNAAKHTPKALPGIIEKLLGDGYKIVPVSELLLTGEYEMEQTGKMCPSKTTKTMRNADDLRHSSFAFVYYALDIFVVLTKNPCIY